MSERELDLPMTDYNIIPTNKVFMCVTFLCFTVCAVIVNIAAMHSSENMLSTPGTVHAVEHTCCRPH